MRQPIQTGIGLKHVQRFEQAVEVMVRHGFGTLLHRIRVWECAHIRRGVLRHECEYPRLSAPERLRLALEELGPTFIKLGQVLSTRPDLVPPEYIVELKKLQAEVATIPAEVVRGVIEAELGRPASEIFDSFDDTPLAAASLAQVHRATLKGQHVAVKVQRPNIEQQIQVDLTIARSLATLAQHYLPVLRPLDPSGFVHEFADQITSELDFAAEARNIKRCASNFAGDETIHVPEVYPRLSTRRVLTMEFIDGINISRTDDLLAAGYNLPLVARRGAMIALKSTFEHGFFHADPHPGNIFVLPGNVIGLVDFGMMGTLSHRDRETLARLVYFISTGNERRLARALNEIMESDDTIPAEKLEPDLAAIMVKHARGTASEMHLASMLFAMMRVILARGGKLRPQLMWLAKGVAIQEEISRLLKADFDMAELGKTYSRKALLNKVNPLQDPQEGYLWALDIIDLAKEIPYDLSIVLKQFRKGRVKIEFEHLGLEPVTRTFSQMANRLAVSIIIAALLISSSLIVLAGIPPLVGDVPILGLVGFAVAIIMGVMLMTIIWLRSNV